MSSSDNKTSHNGDQVTAIRQLLKTLNVHREALENESAAITSELTSRDPEQPNVPPMGVDTPLVDDDGFPRNDIDVFRARTLRHRLMMIRTDHKKLMDEIESALQQLALLLQTPEYKAQLANEEELRKNEKPKPKYDPISGKWVVRNWDGTIAGIPNGETPRSFDEIAEDVPPSELTVPSFGAQRDSLTKTAVVTTDVVMSDSGPTHDMTNASPSPPLQMIHRAAVSLSDCHKHPTAHPPLARVESVAENSPASLAGLMVNDHIIAFGPIVQVFDATSLSTLVQGAATHQEMIEIICQRSTNTDRNNDDDDESMFVLLQLSPHPWQGRGFLGCHIVPC